MTSLTAGLALVPLVVTGNISGQEIEYPMAFVILGGLISSALFNLFVLPLLFGWLARPASAALAKQQV
jgi:Cu/Ag efflux pump CusA